MPTRDAANTGPTSDIVITEVMYHASGTVTVVEEGWLEYVNAGHPSPLVLRGDHELNIVKAGKHPAIATPLEFASDAQVLNAAGAPAGSVGLPLPRSFVDQCNALRSGSTFMNVPWKKSDHFINLNH